MGAARRLSSHPLFSGVPWISWTCQLFRHHVGCFPGGEVPVISVVIHMAKVSATNPNNVTLKQLQMKRLDGFPSRKDLMYRHFQVVH